MTPDALIIGSGPNGLVAAATLAQAGWRVLVLEAQDRPGGALYSLETTLPGFVHDVGAAFFPFAHISPGLRALKLHEVGLEWRAGVYESAHPALDGTCPTISRDMDRAAATFGDDADNWRWLARWMEEMGQRLPDAILGPLPGLRRVLRLGLGNLTRLARAGLSSPAAYARHVFKTEAARRVMPALALHADLGPRDFAAAPLALVLTLLAGYKGFQAPVGGARSITEAILRRVVQNRGTLQLNTRATGIVTHQGRAVAVRTQQGDEIPFRCAVLADVGPPALYRKLLPEDSVPGWVRIGIDRFRYAWGTFKMDWALSAPVPWRAEAARQSAVVHTGESVQDLVDFTAQVRAGRLPDNPYLVIGQQSILDPSRAPEGKQTLWAYSHVPSDVAGGWSGCRERFADQIEERIESLAPGFRQTILARAVFAPDDLERMNENLVGGDLGGGSNQFDQQLFFRPLFPYFRYQTPVARVYLCSASTHPGGGVHGACGYNAARQVLEDFA